MVEMHTADAGKGVRIQYRTAGSGSRVILLIHGYPETSLAWRKVVGPLTEEGFRLIMPDLRGIGGSSRPLDGYDKRTMASDLVAVLDHAGVSDPVHVAGHDIGSMVAFAFAYSYAVRTKTLTVIDAPLPGTSLFQDIWHNGTRAWHFHFHQAPDIPEELTFGREQRYLERFYHDLSYRTDAIENQTVTEYVRAYSQPGAMRAGFNSYRTFRQDSDDTQRAIAERGKLKVPVLAIAGEISPYREAIGPMMSELAQDVTTVAIQETNHWIAEENPQVFANALIDFIANAG